MTIIDKAASLPDYSGTKDFVAVVRRNTFTSIVSCSRSIGLYVVIARTVRTRCCDTVGYTLGLLLPRRWCFI